MSAWQQQLASGLSALETELPVNVSDALETLVEELQRWNRAYNLTAIDRPAEIVSHHLLDSLSLLPWLPPNCKSLLDIGSGAGFPAIPLALARPQMQVTALDAVAKKLRFIDHIQRRLKLNNLRSVHARIEDHEPDPGPEYISARALASLPQLCNWVRHWLADGATLLAMKGRRPDDEIAAVSTAGLAIDSHALSVPGLPAQRHLVIITDPDAKRAAESTE